MRNNRSVRTLKFFFCFFLGGGRYNYKPPPSCDAPAAFRRPRDGSDSGLTCLPRVSPFLNIPCAMVQFLCHSSDFPSLAHSIAPL